MTGDFK